MKKDLKYEVYDIRKSNETIEAIKIAEKLPSYFNKDALAQISIDVTNHSLYGAYSGKEMVGFVTYKEINPKTVEMTWLGVLPERQSKGIGEKLVNETLSELSFKYKVCEVKTLSEFDPYEPYKNTRAFYERMGFIPIETINPYPGWGINPCQIYVKFIGK